VGNVIDVLVRFNALHPAHGGVDRMNNTLETLADQVPENVIADRRVVLACPDNGNSLRIEQDIQVFERHMQLTPRQEKRITR